MSNNPLFRTENASKPGRNGGIDSLPLYCKRMWPTSLYLLKERIEQCHKQAQQTFSWSAHTIAMSPYDTCWF